MPKLENLESSFRSGWFFSKESPWSSHVTAIDWLKTVITPVLTGRDVTSTAQHSIQRRDAALSCLPGKCKIPAQDWYKQYLTACAQQILCWESGKESSKCFPCMCEFESLSLTSPFMFEGLTFTWSLFLTQTIYITGFIHKCKQAVTYTGKNTDRRE